MHSFVFSIIKFIQHQNSDQQIAKIILNCLNSEPIQRFCLQFLEFISPRNHLRCQVLLSNDLKPSGRIKSLQSGHSSHVNLQTLKTEGKYVKICRLCRFRKMLLSVREIPKIKLILDLNKFSVADRKILENHGPSANMKSSQKLQVAFYLYNKSPKIYSNAKSIFMHLEEMILIIESSAGFSDLIRTSTEIRMQADARISLEISENFSGISNDISPDETQIVLKAEMHSTSNIEASNIQQFYKLETKIPRFHENDNVGLNLNNIMDIFQKHTKIIGYNIEKIQKQISSNHIKTTPIEIIPLSIKHGLQEPKHNNKFVQSTYSVVQFDEVEIGWTETINDLESFTTRSNLKLEAKDYLESLVELKEIFKVD